MFRLFRLVSFLMLVLVIGLVAIIGLSYRNTNRFAYLFTRSDGSRCTVPCLLGADPASMTFEQVDETVAGSPVLKGATKNADMQMPMVVYTTGNLRIVTGSDESTFVSLELSSDYPTLGELLMLLGKPKRVYLSKIPPGFHGDPNSPCETVNLFVQERQVILTPAYELECLTRWDQPIINIQVHPPDPLILERSIPWHGSIPDAFYQANVQQLAHPQ